MQTERQPNTTLSQPDRASSVYTNGPARYRRGRLLSAVPGRACVSFQRAPWSLPCLFAARQGFHKAVRSEICFPSLKRAEWLNKTLLAYGEQSRREVDRASGNLKENGATRDRREKVELGQDIPYKTGPRFDIASATPRSHRLHACSAELLPEFYFNRGGGGPKYNEPGLFRMIASGSGARAPPPTRALCCLSSFSSGSAPSK